MKDSLEVGFDKNYSDVSFEFLDVPIIDDDFFKLLFKFSINILVLVLIIRFIYYPITKRKDFLFTYFLISVITFFICFALKKNELGLGLALGLFAVFGIIKYRTDAVPIKEMTYLFVVIGISVINALANNKTSYIELFFINAVVVLITYTLEKVWLIQHESSKIILYEKIELIKPELRAELIKDLEERTGIKINRVSIGKINFLRDTAQVIIYYFDSEQKSISDYSGRDAVGDDD
jgi:hypothetical protein